MEKMDTEVSVGPFMIGGVSSEFYTPLHNEITISTISLKLEGFPLRVQEHTLVEGFQNLSVTFQRRQK